MKDDNKQIERINYTHNNLPKHIVMAQDNQNTIDYLCDAAGTKLQKVTSSDRAAGLTTDYSGPFVYEDSKLAFIQTSEGRIVPDHDTYAYEYFLKDHLGNTRVVFNRQGEVLQSNSYYPFGGMMEGLNYTAALAPENKYLYNGKEFQDDFGLDWYDYGFRMYDSQLGRFSSLDPKADEFVWVSPYNYAENSPIANIDLWGLQKVFFQKALQHNQNFKQAYSANKQSSIGNQFKEVLKNQTTYNVMYAENRERLAAGRIMDISNPSDFNETKKRYSLTLTNKEYDKASEKGEKSVLIITSEQTFEVRRDGSEDKAKSVMTRANVLNHEEGAHGINILLGKEAAGINAEHKEYYGKNCDACNSDVSPNNSDVMNDPKYRNSKAFQNFKEIEKAVENMNIK